MGFRSFASVALLGVMLTGCGGGGGGSDSSDDTNAVITPSPAVPQTVLETTATTTACAIDLQVMFNDLLAATNSVRTERGISPLRFSRKLGQSAQAHAEDMALRDYFAHTSPDGLSTLSSRIDAVDYDFSAAGENLAAGYDIAQEVVDAWLDSPGHRENLLNPDYVDVGFGLAIDTFHSVDAAADFDNYWVQNFGRPTDRNTDVAEAYITSNCNVDLAASPDQSVLSGVIDVENVAVNTPTVLVAVDDANKSVSTPEPGITLGLLPAGLVLLRRRWSKPGA